jgi:hypothetical protein
MKAHEWIARCAGRLEAQWPRIPREQRLEVAQELHLKDEWRSLAPEDAATQWLRQGIPDDAQDAA